MPIVAVPGMVHDAEMTDTPAISAVRLISEFGGVMLVVRNTCHSTTMKEYERSQALVYVGEFVMSAVTVCSPVDTFVASA